jgi:hypothetical protein
MTDFYQLAINVSSVIIDEVMSHLMLIPESVSGCTAIKAEGFGPHQDYQNLQEQIQGATERYLILIILAQPQITPVLNHIKQGFGGKDLFYWVTPILTHGYTIDGVQS